jgi:release factor glutamine methyltransferase
MKTVGQILRLSCEYLKSHNSPFGRLEVEWLIAGILKMGRLDLYLKYDQPLNEGELHEIRTKLKRLARGEPLQYIEGSVNFLGCQIFVDRRVLIPRPETELLVQHVLKNVTKENMTVVDVCTGSGCIGIACKKKSLHPVDVWLLDLSSDALLIAKENAFKNHVDVRIVHSDLLEALADSSIDLLVANPPYVSEAEYQALDLHIRDFEPKQALVGGPTGLEIYERLAFQIHKKVRPGGRVFFEIGESQKKPMEKLLIVHGYKEIEFFYDLCQKIRFVAFTV